MCPPTFPFLGTEVLAFECNLNVYASKNRVAICKHEQQDETQKDDNITLRRENGLS
jgi:hypothetical protein